MAEVLVVDDDADIRTMLDLALGLDGHDVTTVSHGEEALTTLIERAEAGRSPVVVLDVEMPGMNGWQVLEAIRADARLDAVAVTMCTVKAMQADEDIGARLGCDAYQSKPFDIAGLSQHLAEMGNRTLEDLLSHRASERQAISS